MRKLEGEEHLGGPALLGHSPVRRYSSGSISLEALQVGVEGGLVDGLQAAVTECAGCVLMPTSAGGGRLQQLAVLLHMSPGRLQPAMPLSDTAIGSRRNCHTLQSFVVVIACASAHWACFR